RFFFFQAEDGIRAFHVTGVQTCALPIYLALDVARGEVVVIVEADLANRYHSGRRRPAFDECDRLGTPSRPRSGPVWMDSRCEARSEERRAGKACTAAWSAGGSKRARQTK